MNWKFSLLIAVLTGVLGLFGSGLVTCAYEDWYHVSSHDIGAAFLIIDIAVLGGITAFVIGLIAARVVGPGFGKALGCASGIVLGIAGLVTVMLYLLADFPPTIDGEELTLELEIKLPVGHAKPSGETLLRLSTSADHVQFSAENGELKLSEAHLENERWIVPAEVFLFTSRGPLTMSASIGSEGIGDFVVPLPARPGKANEQWSEWFPQPRAGDPPWPDTQSSFRFRVRRIPPPPPPLTDAEFEAQNEAEAQSKFDSIPADASISAWMEYTELHIPRSAAALPCSASSTSPRLSPSLTP